MSLQTVGTVFAGTPPWPLVWRTGAYWNFIEPDPLPPDPTLRKPVFEKALLTLEYVKQWPGSTAADVWRGLQLKKRDDAMRYLSRLVREGYLSYEMDYHEITNLPIRRYTFIDE